MRPTTETYLALEKAYAFLNQRFFQQALPPCMITLQRR